MTTFTIPIEKRKPTLVSEQNFEQATIEKPNFVARSLYIGEHIDLRPFLRAKRTPAQQPAIVSFSGGGLVLVFRYGAVVFFDASLEEQQRFQAELLPFVRHAYEHPEIEELEISVNPTAPDGDVGQSLGLKDASIERLQTVASVLSKSVALAQYEADVDQNFEQLEPLAMQLEEKGYGGRQVTPLLRHIGRALRNELKMVARVEVTDRPDLIWDRPDLANLYRKLEEEFELQERAAILDRKLDLISRTAGTVLELLHRSRSIRVEWYIVVLIVVELALAMYQLVARGI
jgi:uncharacterized Rmd1/YagE family protein